ncbi:MAG: hypothetical protein FJZ43_02935 [Candidatus Staskawiczbacteria bacterium]|nr:hypothetical protein [Candidatus Staskawiczbacteria bacterium]
MDRDLKENKMSDNVIGQIKNGTIKMKPRSYFMLRGFLLGGGIFLLFLFVVYLASFIVFSLRISGVWFLPLFGFLGARILLGSLPWVLILLSVALIIAIEIFAERISFIYKRPVIMSLVGVILIVLIAGLLVGLTSFHPRIFYKSQEENIPVIGSFYKRYSLPKIENVYNGVISKIDNEKLEIETSTGQFFELHSGANLIEFRRNIKEGDAVIIIGDKENDFLKVRMIREIKEDLDFFPSKRKIKKIMENSNR